MGGNHQLHLHIDFTSAAEMGLGGRALQILSQKMSCQIDFNDQAADDWEVVRPGPKANTSCKPAFQLAHQFPGSM